MPAFRRSEKAKQFTDRDETGKTGQKSSRSSVAFIIRFEKLNQAHNQETAVSGNVIRFSIRFDKEAGFGLSMKNFIPPFNYRAAFCKNQGAEAAVGSVQINSAVELE